MGSVAGGAPCQLLHGREREKAQNMYHTEMKINPLLRFPPAFDRHCLCVSWAHSHTLMLVQGAEMQPCSTGWGLAGDRNRARPHLEADFPVDLQAPFDNHKPVTK